MTYTTIKQSKALMHLGLDEKTADMYYQQTEDAVDCWEVHIGKKNAQNELPQIPCWSAEALLDILPKQTCTKNGKNYCLDIEKINDDNSYFIGYIKYEYAIEGTGELIPILIKIIEWLLTNKLINMTEEEIKIKAKEIAQNNGRIYRDQEYGDIDTEEECYDSAIKMAEWVITEMKEKYISVPSAACILSDESGDKLVVTTDLSALKRYKSIKNNIKNSSDKAL